VNGKRIATHLVLVAVLIATIGCDRVTKQLATRTLAGAPDRAFLAGTIRVAYAENTGGFLSVGADWSAGGRAAIFVVATGLLLVGMALAMVLYRWDRWSLLGATLFLAGGASNWLDRVQHGRVVDFLNLGVGPLRTGVFNVADIAILTGLVLLLGLEVRKPATPDDQRGVSCISAS
jgi:signal peptidase II